MEIGLAVGSVPAALETGGASLPLTAFVLAGGVIETRYVSGVLGADTWLARVTTGGGGAWLLSDYQGSIMLVVGLTGGVQDAIVYDGFGNITSESNPNARGALGFQGGRYDATTGNWVYGVRELNPNTLQWMTQDPSGLGPDVNPRRFVNNNPTDGMDPSGLAVSIPLGFLAGEEASRSLADFGNEQKSLVMALQNVSGEGPVRNFVENSAATIITAIKDGPDLLRLLLLRTLVSAKAEVVLWAPSKVKDKDILLVPDKNALEPTVHGEINGLKPGLFQLLGISRITEQLVLIDPVIFDQQTPNGRRGWASTKIKIILHISGRLPRIGEVSNFKIEMTPPQRFVVPPGAIGDFPFVPARETGVVDGFVPILVGGQGVRWLSVVSGQSFPPKSTLGIPDSTGKTPLKPGSEFTLPDDTNFPSG